MFFPFINPLFFMGFLLDGILRRFGLTRLFKESLKYFSIEKKTIHLNISNRMYVRFYTKKDEIHIRDIPID